MNPNITPIGVKNPFKYLCMSIGYIPTSYKECMDYYEQMLWLIKFLENTVIPAVDNNAAALTELQGLFVTLKNYVEHYFDNLDVQNEINNKLDEMVEDGTLQEIITDYLNSKAIFGFDTVADMKEATNLIAGSFAKTLGFHTLNDDGGATYKIREITNSDVVDEMSIISIGEDNLIAEFIIEDNKINIDQFGAKGDNSTDNKNIIQHAIDFCLEKGITLELSKKTYLISDSLILNKTGSIRTKINGNFGIIKGTFDDYLIKANISGSEQFIIENIELNGNFRSNGILINKSLRFSLKNILFHYCTKGLTIINSWYGNIDNNCIFATCLHAINLLEDLDDQYYGENNTIEFGNLSIDSHNVLPSAFNSEDEHSTGILVEGVVHSVKFVGTVVENVDIAIKGCTTLRSGYSSLVGLIIFDKCYFEAINYRLIDWAGTNSNYVNTLFIFTNNNLYPINALEAYINHSKFFIQNNKNFYIKPYEDNRQLELITDMNDYFIDTNKYNYTTRVEKIQNKITHSSTMNVQDMSVKRDYPDAQNMTLSVQNDNYLMYQFWLNNGNVAVKNSKAFSVNSKNISFDSQDLNPVGIVINGTDGKKYMLSTDDGSDIKLIEMKNLNRIYERANSYSAYWLYAHKNDLDNGFKAYCNDIGKNVKLVKTNNVGEWWTDESNSYLCIGTSESLLSNLSVQPVIYWRPCWDLSFNHGVYLQGNRYVDGYDWSMNNDPHDTNTEIAVYGTISQRPSSPSYKAIYYATDENKYYIWNLSSWSEVTKIM